MQAGLTKTPSQGKLVPLFRSQRACILTAAFKVPQQPAQSAHPEALPHAAFSRRSMQLAGAGLLLGQGLSAMQGRPAEAVGLLSKPVALPPSCSQRRLDGQLAAALTGAVYAAVMELQVAREDEFQREVYRLRDREYPYYYEANKEKLPRIPDLSDMSGGLSNPTYFNYVDYILWKVVARRVQGEQRRTAFGAVFARTALQRVWPEGEEAALAAAGAAAQQRAYPPSPAGASQQVLAVYTPTADSGIAGSLSQKHAYQAAAQQSMAALVALTPDGASTAQPMVQQVAYESTSPQPQARLSSSSPALMYTDSTHNVSNSVQSRPGSRSLAGIPSKPRAQEADVLLLVTQLLGILQDKGYVCGWQVVWGEVPGGWAADWMVGEVRVVGSPSDPAADAAGQVLQVKLHRPADIEGSIALRAEEDGFWGRAVSSMMLRLLQLAGYSTSVVDEYFYQDEWQGPSRLSDRILLFLGDPLEQVDVPFTPTTLVQNYTLN